MEGQWHQLPKPDVRRDLQHQQAPAGPANGGKDPHDGTYPNPFRSVGDFRKAPLRDPKVLELDEMGHQRLGARPDAQAMDAAAVQECLKEAAAMSGVESRAAASVPDAMIERCGSCSCGYLLWP